MARIRGVILDVDGTLVDSNDAHAKAWIAAMAENGYRIPFEAVRKLIGMGGDKLLPLTINVEEKSPIGKRIGKRRKEIFMKEHLPRLFPTPGAEELLAELSQRGWRMVVASSATEEELTPLLRRCRADWFIESKTSSDDAENSKPDPDIIHAALGRLKMPPGDALMLGDTPYDIEAAGRAGVKTVAFRCGGWKDDGLKGAIAVYDGPADLLARFDGSPFARKG